MRTFNLDARGQSCPLPTLKMTNLVMSRDAQPGDTLEVLADCGTFEEDVKRWCATMRKELVVLEDQPPNGKRAVVRI